MRSPLPLGFRRTCARSCVRCCVVAFVAHACPARSAGCARARHSTASYSAQIGGMNSHETHVAQGGAHGQAALCRRRSGETKGAGPLSRIRKGNHRGEAEEHGFVVSNKSNADLTVRIAMYTCSPPRCTQRHCVKRQVPLIMTPAVGAPQEAVRLAQAPLLTTTARTVLAICIRQLQSGPPVRLRR